MSYSVMFYQTTRGNFPVKDFIEKQQINTQAKIAHFIYLLTEYGPFLKPPESKKIHTRLHELRIKHTISIRIIYTFDRQTFYLLHAFIKKTNKIPHKEIRIALDRQRLII